MTHNNGINKLNQMPSNTIRSFFAIKIPRYSIEAIEALLFDLKRLIPKRIKWVAANSMHVTIKFIGDFNVLHKEPVHKDLLSIIYRIGKMKISFTEIGGFPNLNKPRVICLGLDYPKNLREIAQAVDSIANNYGYPKETRRFSPHVTLGRIRKDSTSIERERIGKIINENRQVEIPPFECEKLYFFQSTLTPNGPIYSLLAEIPL